MNHAVLDHLGPDEKLSILKRGYKGEIPFEPQDELERSMLICWLESRVSNKTIKRILTPVKTKGNDYSVVLVVLFAILLTVGLNYAWVLLLNHVCLWLFGWAVTWQHMTIIFVGCCIWNNIFRRDERK